MRKKINNRYLAHALTSVRQVNKAFPESSINALEQQIAKAEQGSSGQIRLVIESSWPLVEVRGGQPRERALDWFSRLRIWDTENNNGVLIYLLFAEHDVEIVADRGISSRIPAEEWAALCRLMEAEFAAGQFEKGLTLGITAAGKLLRQHFPAASSVDELPNRPLIV